MPPLRPSSPSEDSESDAPETISLTQSKKSIRKQAADIRKAEASVREKARSKNREKDLRLKERAMASKEKNEERGSVDVLDKGNVKGNDDRSKGEGGEEVEARMLRAINDAEDEHSEGVGDDEDREGGSDLDGGSMDEDETEYSDLSDGDEAMSADEVDLASMEPPTRSISKQINYLPDELFQAAFSQQATKPRKNDLESNKNVVTKNDKSRKKISSSSTPKDILVGSRTVRMFQTSKSQPVPSTSNPSAKANKFLDRALGLKGQRLKKGWERKPANIGVLRRNGPAAHFVRNQ